jgi:hypothetical protein
MILKSADYTDKCMWKEWILQRNLRKGCNVPQRREREVGRHIRRWFNDF